MREMLAEKQLKSLQKVSQNRKEASEVVDVGARAFGTSYMTVSDSISLSVRVCRNARDLHVFK